MYVSLFHFISCKKLKDGCSTCLDFQYYWCVLGQPELEACSQGLVWWQDQGRCDWPENVPGGLECIGEAGSGPHHRQSSKLQPHHHLKHDGRGPRHQLPGGKHVIPSSTAEKSFKLPADTARVHWPNRWRWRVLIFNGRPLFVEKCVTVRSIPKPKLVKSMLVMLWQLSK